MEILYFPLFLVVAAVLVIWLFSRARSNSRRRKSRDVKTPSGRSANSDRLQRSMDRRGPAVGRRPQIGGNTANDMWRTRRQRAKHQASAVSEPGVDSQVFYAGFTEKPKTYGSRKNGEDGLQDQDVPQTEHIGIEEYLSKKERERIAAEKAAAERAAAEGSGLTMTAIKYESGEESASDNAQPKEKQAGFKP